MMPSKSRRLLLVLYVADILINYKLILNFYYLLLLYDTFVGKATFRDMMKVIS